MLIKCPECNSDVSSVAAACPKCGHPIAASGKPEITGSKPTDVKKAKSGCGKAILVIVCLVIGLAIIGSLSTPHSTSTATQTASNSDTSSTDAAPTPTPLLELKSSRCSIEYGYITTEGSVTNISGESLKSVEAVGGYYDNEGNLITTSDAIIEYNPILPGQTSPFKTMHTMNPAIKRCDVTFKYLMGGTIDTRRAEPSTGKKGKAK